MEVINEKRVAVMVECKVQENLLSFVKFKMSLPADPRALPDLVWLNVNFALRKSITGEVAPYTDLQLI